MWNEGPPGSWMELWGWMVHAWYWEDEWMPRVGNIGKGKGLFEVAVVQSRIFVAVIGLAMRVNNREPKLHCEVDGTAWRMVYPSPGLVIH